VRRDTLPGEINDYILQQASFSRLLLLTVIMMDLGILVISPISPSEELMALANGRNVPDTQFNRSAADFYDQLAAYGENCRRLYLTRISPVDLFIPLTQALFLAVAISLAARRALAPGSDWQLLNLLPFVAMLGDYLENASIAGLMQAYPTRLDGLAMLFTAVKFIFTITSVGGMLLAGVAWLSQRGRRPKVGIR